MFMGSSTEIGMLCGGYRGYWVCRCLSLGFGPLRLKEVVVGSHASSR